ncbi:MAG: methyltransferase domain-containing protein [Sedimentisphaerales bacterium]
MNTDKPVPKKTFIRAPDCVPLTMAQKIRLALKGGVLSPIYLLLAYYYHVPGLQLRGKCARLGLRLLLTRKAPLAYRTVYSFFFWPMDSVRHFEFDFMWRMLADTPIQHYLDVSSPRLFPTLLLRRHRTMSAEFLNPDAKDLAITTALIKSSGLSDRCHFHNCLIGEAPFAPESFDVITSISVVEHIPQDTQAIQKMWTMLKRGGRLLLSMPCAAEALEEYIDQNEYGLLEPDKNGFIFWQRFYDPLLLQERIFSITGQPNCQMVYGEKKAGAIINNTQHKRADPKYPLWREPYMMGQEYGYFKSIADLPGQGVVAMEFIKR